MVVGAHRCLVAVLPRVRSTCPPPASHVSMQRLAGVAQEDAGGSDLKTRHYIHDYTCIWATVNIWCVALSHQFLRSVSSFSKFWDCICVFPISSIVFWWLFVSCRVLVFCPSCAPPIGRLCARPAGGAPVRRLLYCRGPAAGRWLGRSIRVWCSFSLGLFVAVRHMDGYRVGCPSFLNLLFSVYYSIIARWIINRHVILLGQSLDREIDG